MSIVTFSADSPLPATSLVELATSGCLDEISNAPDAIRHYIRNQCLVTEGVTNRPKLFAIYETGRYGPQNGFRLCLVHEGFVVGDTETTDADAKAAIEMAQKPVAQGAKEWIVLGVAPPPIADPE